MREEPRVDVHATAAGVRIDARHRVPIDVPVGIQEVHPVLIVVVRLFIEHHRVGRRIEGQALADVDVGTVVVYPRGLRVFRRGLWARSHARQSGRGDDHDRHHGSVPAEPQPRLSRDGAGLRRDRRPNRGAVVLCPVASNAQHFLR